jgi:mono/diheme cytochrome c family protein
MENSDSSDRPVRSKSLVITSVVVVALLILFVGWTLAGKFLRKAPSSTAFDPAGAPELVIKGVAPEAGSSWIKIEVLAAPASSAQLVARGKDLFAQACAGCHGAGGAGDGPVTLRSDFVVLPADLTKPHYSIKIRSTAERSPPLPEDMFRTITRGFPDSPMWSYRHLPAEDRWALVHYIRSLSPKYSDPVEKVELPPKPEETEALRRSGASFYSKTCINCHGQIGMGAPGAAPNPQTYRPYPGIAFARAGGSLTMSGDSDEDIARTLLTGLGGASPMKSMKPQIYLENNPARTAEYDRQFWGLVFHVRQLMREQKAK